MTVRHRHHRSLSCKLLAALGMTLTANTAYAQGAGPEPRMVTVEGRMVRVVLAGLEDRTRNQPVVIFESGSGGGIESWNPVFAAVLEFAPVVAYDRPGIGQSDIANEPPTPQWVARHLHSLLTALNVPPPYVLVGHSWGGALVRYYAGLYPREIVGVVYVDPVDFTLTRQDELAFWESIGVAETDYDAFREEARNLYARLPAGLRAEYQIIEEFQNAQHRDLPPMPEVPVAVLLGSRQEAPPTGIDLPFDFTQYSQSLVRLRVDRFGDLVLKAAQGTLVVATHAGHFVQNDDPILVVEAIQRVAF